MLGKFDESKRPKVGIGVLICNEYHEVLAARRKPKRGSSEKPTYAFPGGWIEHGESFVQAAGREVYEETGVKLPQNDIKFITCLNCRENEVHNVAIWMFVEVDKADYKFVNLEPEKTNDWYWHKWNDFIVRDDLFYPFKEFIKQGYQSMKKIKQQCGIEIYPDQFFIEKHIKMDPCTTTYILAVKKLNNNAKMPVQGSEDAAGYDLFSDKSFSVPAQGKCCVTTGIAVKIPEDHYGRIAPRSGLASKKSIHVGAGVISEDSRGEIKVILFNHGQTDFEVLEGDRIAQLIVQKIQRTEIVQIRGKLGDTQRGEKGFGSTGLRELNEKIIEKKDPQELGLEKLKQYAKWQQGEFEKRKTMASSFNVDIEESGAHAPQNNKKKIGHGENQIESMFGMLKPGQEDEKPQDFRTVPVPDDWQEHESQYQLLSEYANRRYIISLTLEDRAVRSSLYDHELNEADFNLKFTEGQEIDPLDYWKNVRDGINQLIERNNLQTQTSERVIGLGIVNCSKAVMALNRITGQPCGKIKTGENMLENYKKVKEECSDDKLEEIVFCGLETWVIAKLTAMEQIVTDPTNSELSGLIKPIMSRNKTKVIGKRWNEEILNELEITEDNLPEVITNSANYFGDINATMMTGSEITGLIYKTQAECVGHALEPGEMSINFKTDKISIKIVTDEEMQIDNFENQQFTVVEQKQIYVLCTSLLSANIGIDWAKKLGMLKRLQEIQEVQMGYSDGVVFDSTKKAMLGMKTDTNQESILRAILEEPCLRIADLLQKIRDKQKVSTIFVTGNVNQSQAFMQTLANVTGVKIIGSKFNQIASRGAAIVAGLFVDFWLNHEKVKDIIGYPQIFEPKSDEKTRTYNLNYFRQKLEGKDTEPLNQDELERPVIKQEQQIEIKLEQKAKQQEKPQINISSFEGKGHFVVPKTDCPHCTSEYVVEKSKLKVSGMSCQNCESTSENWVCLYPNCGGIFCSRYVKSHMVDSHYKDNQNHCLTLSLRDGSFWCYKCDSYVAHPVLNHQIADAKIEKMMPKQTEAKPKQQQNEKQEEKKEQINSDKKVDQIPEQEECKKLMGRLTDLAKKATQIFHPPTKTEVKAEAASKPKKDIKARFYEVDKISSKPIGISMKDALDQVLKHKLIYIGLIPDQLNNKHAVMLAKAIQQQFMKKLGTLHIVIEQISFEMQFLLEEYLTMDLTFTEFIQQHACIQQGEAPMKGLKSLFQYAQTNSSRIELHSGGLPSGYTEMLHKQGSKAAFDQAKARGYVGVNDNLKGSEPWFDHWKKQFGKTKRLEYESHLLKQAAIATTIKRLMTKSVASDKILVLCSRDNNGPFGIQTQTKTKWQPKVEDQSIVVYSREPDELLGFEGFPPEKTQQVKEMCLQQSSQLILTCKNEIEEINTDSDSEQEQTDDENELLVQDEPKVNLKTSKANKKQKILIKEIPDSKEEAKKKEKDDNNKKYFGLDKKTYKQNKDRMILLQVPCTHLERASQIGKALIEAKLVESAKIMKGKKVHKFWEKYPERKIPPKSKPYEMRKGSEDSWQVFIEVETSLVNYLAVFDEVEAVYQKAEIIVAEFQEKEQANAEHEEEASSDSLYDPVLDEHVDEEVKPLAQMQDEGPLLDKKGKLRFKSSALTDDQIAKSVAGIGSFKLEN